MSHDPNYSCSTDRNGGSGGISPQLTDEEPLIGNQFRDVWKLACWQMSEEDDYSLYERAIYASLSVILIIYYLCVKAGLMLSGHILRYAKAI